MTPDNFSSLLQKYLRQELTEDESTSLLEAAAQPEFQEVLGAAVDNSFRDPDIAGLSTPEQAALALQRFRAIVHPPPRIARMRTWWKYAAAAALLVIAAGAWWWMREPVQQTPVVVTRPVQDVMPGSTKAILTLADGSVVTLDSSGRRVIAQGDASIQQSGGSLSYNAGNTEAPVTYNILTIPRGGQFQLTLSDGTRVWLNAASSLRYPVAFKGKDRLVEVTGEAYFEVARNVKQPFRVKVNQRAAVEVLGTSFNVNAYEDERAIKTTLLEGGVRVSSTVHSVVLRPGEQAIDREGAAQITIVNDADLNKVMAWKNGLFNFENARIDEVMRQIARWYDLEIVYEKGVPDIYFVGEMSRNIKLSGLLLALEDSKVHFRLEGGHKLIVLP